MSIHISIIFILVIASIVTPQLSDPLPDHPLQSIDFSEAYPFVQHIDSYIQYKTQLEQFPNMLLFIYLPWDSIALYEVKQSILEIFKQYQSDGNLFREHNNSTLYGFIKRSDKSLFTLGSNTEERFIIRAINYYNIIDKDLKEKIMILTSPQLRFVLNGNQEKYFFYSHYSPFLIDRFITLSLHRKPLGFNDYIYNDNTANGTLVQNEVCKGDERNMEYVKQAMENILLDEHLLIGYFYDGTDHVNNHNYYLQKYYNITFNYVQPLRVRFVILKSESEYKSYFSCHTQLKNAITNFKKSQVILYKYIKNEFEVFDGESRLITDWLIEKYEPLVGELQSQSSSTFLKQEEQVILFLEDRNDLLIANLKHLSYEIYKQSGKQPHISFVEKEFGRNLFRSHIKVKNGKELTVFNFDEQVKFPSLMININNTIYLLDKCINSQFENQDVLLKCYSKFKQDSSKFIHHNSKNTKSGISYSTLTMIMNLEFRPKVTLVYLYSSSFGSENYYHSMLNEIDQETNLFIDIFYYDVAYNDIPEKLSREKDLQVENLPYFAIISQHGKIKFYKNDSISYTLLKKWIIESIAYSVNTSVDVSSNELNIY